MWHEPTEIQCCQRIYRWRHCTVWDWARTEPISPVACWDTKRYKRLDLLKVKMEVENWEKSMARKVFGVKAAISNVYAPQWMIYIVLLQEQVFWSPITYIRTILFGFVICNQVCIRSMSTAIVKNMSFGFSLILWCGVDYSSSLCTSVSKISYQLVPQSIVSTRH